MGDGMRIGSASRAALVGALALVVLLLAASSASAATYCVGSPPSCSGGTTEPDLQAALDAAAATSQADTVFVGSGTFTGPFTYAGTGSGNTVTINGSNPGVTNLTVTNASQTVLSLSGAPGSSVGNLSILLPAKDSDTGLSLGTGDSGVGVNVTDQGGATHATGVSLNNADFSGFTATDKAAIYMGLGTSQSGNSIGISAAGTSSVKNVSIGGPANFAVGFGIEAIGGPVDLTVDQASIESSQPMFLHATSGDLTTEVDDAVLLDDAQGGNGAAVDVFNGTGHNASFTGRHLTLEGGGSNSYGVQVTNFDSNDGGATDTATIDNSIIGESSAFSGPGHPLGLEGEGSNTSANAARTTGTLTYSDAHTSADQIEFSMPATLNDTSHNIDQDPMFNSGTDLGLQSGSPAIDAASKTLVGSSSFDVAGNPRTVNPGSGTVCPNSGDNEPCPDMGAYERQPSAGPPPVLSNIESTPLDYPANDPPEQITQTLAASDSSSPTIAGATVKIAPGYDQGNDFLGFAPQNGISGSFSNTTGTLTLSGTTSVANYQTALRSITFSNGNTSDPSSATRTVTYQVNDGSQSSNTVSRDVRFDTGPPIVNTYAPTVTNASNIVLHGDVNPQGIDTHWHFQYGPDLDHMPNDVPSSAGNDLNALDHTAHQVNFPLSVNAGQQTCFRLVADNSKGTTYGNDAGTPPGKGVCVGPPIANTTAPTIVDPYNVVMHGNVNPEDLDTHWHFQYGPDLDHMPNDLPSSAGNDVGASDYTAHDVSYPLAVTPGQQTCFRLVTDNAMGTTYANDGGNPPGKGVCVTTQTASSSGGSPSQPTRPSQPSAPPPGPPTVTTGCPLDIEGDDSAMLTGTVNPNNSTTKYWWKWTSDGLTVGPTPPVTLPTTQAGDHLVVRLVDPAFTLLAPGSVVHYRLYAQNASSNGPVEGDEQHYTTPLFGSLGPDPFATNGDCSGAGKEAKAQTGAIDTRTDTDATVKGTVDAHGQPTVFRVQYFSGPIVEGDEGESAPQVLTDGADHALTFKLPYLQPGIRYRYRVIGVNRAGITFGDFQDLQAKGSCGSNCTVIWDKVVVPFDNSVVNGVVTISPSLISAKTARHRHQVVLGRILLRHVRHGVLSLHVPLTRQGRRRLARVHRSSLRATLTLTITPPRGRGHRIVTRQPIVVVVQHPRLRRRRGHR